MRIVLLPGLDGTGLLFEPLCGAFSSTIQATIVDYPRQRETSYDELVGRIRTELPTTEPFILLGESYGGPLALKLAAEQPAGLCGVILSASFVTCPQRIVPGWSARLIVPSMFRLAPMLGMLQSVVGRYMTRDIRALIDNAVAKVAPAVMAARLKEVVSIDVTNELLGCPVALLYIQGTRDFVVPAGNFEKIQRLRPDVKAVRIDAPHMILQTRTTAAAEVIEQFANEAVNSSVESHMDRGNQV